MSRRNSGGEAPSLAKLEPMVPPQVGAADYRDRVGWSGMGLVILLCVRLTRGAPSATEAAADRTAPQNSRGSREGSAWCSPAGGEPSGAGTGQGILPPAHRHRPPVCRGYDRNPRARADHRGIPARHAIACGVSPGAFRPTRGIPGNPPTSSSTPVSNPVRVKSTRPSRGSAGSRARPAGPRP